MADGRDPSSGERYSYVTVKGCCESCEIDYYIGLMNGVPRVWVLDAPNPNELSAPLTEGDIANLNAKLSRYKALGQSWKIFLSHARATDRLWRYMRNDDGRTGITHVRCGIAIDRFESFGNL
jgi:hypothetical protein